MNSVASDTITLIIFAKSNTLTLLSNLFKTIYILKALCDEINYKDYIDYCLAEKVITDGKANIFRPHKALNNLSPIEFLNRHNSNIKSLALFWSKHEEGAHLYLELIQTRMEDPQVLSGKNNE